MAERACYGGERANPRPQLDCWPAPGPVRQVRSIALNRDTVNLLTLLARIVN